MFCQHKEKEIDYHESYCPASGIMTHMLYRNKMSLMILADLPDAYPDNLIKLANVTRDRNFDKNEIK